MERDTKILNDIKLTKDLKEAVIGQEVIVMAVPSVFVRKTASQVTEYLKRIIFDYIIAIF